MIFANSTKIIFTIDTIHRGGKERQLFILTRFLLDKGFNISIIAKEFSHENYLKEYEIDLRLIKVFNGNTWLGKFLCFRRIIISENPDFIISWDIQSSIYTLLLTRKFKFKFINASIRHGIRLVRFSHILRSVVCFLSPYIIANSFEGLKANNLKPGKRRVVLYNGIENKFINTLTKTDREKQRNKLIPGYAEKHGTVYITIANLVPYKDYSTVLKALHKLKELHSFYYLIIGDGPMRDEIVGIIYKYGLEKRIILTGEIENISDYLFISDIMIHSSRGEGISNSILEGMYAGLPVIATNVGGIPETVFPGSSILFPYKDDKALFECLLQASVIFSGFDKDSEEYKKHLAKFSVRKMIKGFEKIIQTVESN